MKHTSNINIHKPFVFRYISGSALHRAKQGAPVPIWLSETSFTQEHIEWFLADLLSRHRTAPQLFTGCWFGVWETQDSPGWLNEQKQNSPTKFISYIGIYINIWCDLCGSVVSLYGRWIFISINKYRNIYAWYCVSKMVKAGCSPTVWDVKVKFGSPKLYMSVTSWWSSYVQLYQGASQVVSFWDWNSGLDQSLNHLVSCCMCR